MKLAFPTLFTLCSIAGAFAQVSVNINDNKAISNAQQQIAARLMRYYSPNTLGTISEKTSEEADGFQWFEMGFYWMAVAQYSDVGNDYRFADTLSGALANSSFGKTASFLGGADLESFSAGIGKWNDDILWWALAAVHGAEVLGKDHRTPLGSTLFDIAKNTYIEVRDQWDDLCGGGLYWARNRNDNVAAKRTYKSTITNVEQIILAARLHKLTNDQEYLDHAIRIYNWLLGPSGIITQDGKVFDGAHSDRCSEIVDIEHSYNAGLFLGGAALLFDATKDAKYMNSIRTVLNNYEKVFVRNNIFIDPCEEANGSIQTCKKNQAQFKGVAIFSLNYVYQYSSDVSIKNKVKTWIETSASAMFKTCNPQFDCSNFWIPETTNRPSDVHNQMNALFMSNALSNIRSATVQGGVKKPSKSGGMALVIPIGIWSSIFTVLYLL